MNITIGIFCVHNGATHPTDGPAGAGAVLLGPRLLDLLWSEGGELGERHRDGLLPAVQLVVEVHHVAPQAAVVPETGAGRDFYI